MSRLKKPQRFQLFAQYLLFGLKRLELALANEAFSNVDVALSNGVYCRYWPFPVCRH